jgi:hypothetical protein
MVAADLLSTAVTSEIQNSPEAQAITGFISEQLNVGLTAVSFVIAVGAGFLVFNTLSMAVTQRLADLGRLRAIGMTSSQIVKSILIEASFLGSLGVLIGIPAGVLLTTSTMRLLETTSSMFNQFGDPEISIPRLILSGALGLMVAMVAALTPARRAGRVSPSVGWGKETECYSDMDIDGLDDQHPGVSPHFPACSLDRTSLGHTSVGVDSIHLVERFRHRPARVDWCFCWCI